MAISDTLMKILACPRCKGDIKATQDGKGLVCERCRLVYEVRDDIPIMLADQAVTLGKGVKPAG